MDAIRALFCCVLALLLAACAAEKEWEAPLRAEVERIDANTPGTLGVYVRRIADGSELEIDAARRWYLSSTIKVPVAIAVLEAVEEGRLSLSDELELTSDAFVDGSGDLVWQKPGGRYTIAALLEKSIRNSDSVATDLLIRVLGVDALNRRVAQWSNDGFGPITTILQVRYDAYGEMHPSVAKLSNLDLIALKRAPAGAARAAALAKTLGIESSEFAYPEIETAFERYYARGRNSATLQAFGDLLQRLVAGELLNPEHTALLLDHMRAISTGARRIQAGLPPGTAFAQKTGTQIERACNVGIIDPQDVARAVVIVACLERFGTITSAERALAALGRAIQASGVRAP
jgi:beta-lactamase class A